MSLKNKYALVAPDYHWKAIRPSLKMDLATLARYQLVLKVLGSKINRLRILDVGCGDGVLSWMLAKRGAEVCGIDINEEAIKVAQKKCKNINANFCAASIYNIPFPSRHFDSILCIDVIEHLQKPHEALNELKRVWNKSGPMIITTPIKWRDVPKSKFHVKEYTVREFRRLIMNHFPRGRIFFMQFVSKFVSKRLNKLKLGKYEPVRVFLNALYLVTRVNIYLIPSPWKNMSQAAIIYYSR